MFAKLALISSVLVSSVFAAGAMINTPATLTQCQPTALCKLLKSYLNRLQHGKKQTIPL